MCRNKTGFCSVKFDNRSYLTKTLGLQWNPDADSFIFLFSSRQTNRKITNCSVLSIIAQLYDPLGLIGRVVCKAKIFLQRLWIDIDQNESLPMPYQTVWLQFSIQNMTFSLYVRLPNASLQLHGFCDANLSVYGTYILMIQMFSQRATSLYLGASFISTIYRNQTFQQ